MRTNEAHKIERYNWTDTVVENLEAQTPHSRCKKVYALLRYAIASNVSNFRATMIDLYTWTTPNGRKVSILLEELGIEYNVHAIDISKDEQFAPNFLAIAPNNRIPAIVDQETNIAMMESGAIMQYLAEKHGRFLSTDHKTRWATIEWLNWQMGGLGPMAGQTHPFVKYNPGKSQYALLYCRHSLLAVDFTI